MSRTHTFESTKDSYGYGYYGYIEDGQLVFGVNWPREGGDMYVGSFEEVVNKPAWTWLKESDIVLFNSILTYYGFEPVEVIVKPEPKHNFYASEARYISDKANKPVDPWDKLFKLIKEQAGHGRTNIIVDEEDDDVHFTEHRKEVKNELELLGFKVEYSRVMDRDSFYYGSGDKYHNRYMISW